MLADFARRRGMDIEWIEADRPDQLYSRLRRGDGDVVAADLPPEQLRDGACWPAARWARSVISLMAVNS
jgi:membrane-bound lytic murein transglycosylase MltF